MSFPRFHRLAPLSSAVALALAAVAVLVSGCGPAYPNCETDTHCKAKGEYCVDSKCAQCRLDSHCPGAGTDICVSCVAGACGRKADCCTNKLDCGSGKQCLNNKCAAECSADVQCPAGHKCMAGSCILPDTSVDGASCLSDKDCKGGTCVKGKCSSGGAGQVDCSKLDPALFDFNEYTLSSNAQNIVSASAKCLKERNISTVTIEGHCDERGTDAYNMELGNRRATAVREYLKTVAPKVTAKTISYGKTKPVCNEDNESCWGQNRRAEFRAKGK